MTNPVFDDLGVYPRPKRQSIEWTPNPKTFEQYFGNLMLLGLDILCDRQAKYGPGNIEKGGLLGLQTRMTDKIERNAQQLNGRIVNGQVILDDPNYPDDERPFDGEFDLSNYALIQIAVKDGNWGRFPLDPAYAEGGEDPT